MVIEICACECLLQLCVYASVYVTLVQEANLLGTKGPRRMHCIIPAMTETGAAVCVWLCVLCTYVFVYVSMYVGVIGHLLTVFNSAHLRLCMEAFVCFIVFYAIVAVQRWNRQYV